MSDPAAEFGELLHSRLAGRPALAVPDTPAAVLAPRPPAPNPAQGSSGLAGPPQLHPADAFAALFHGLGSAMGDGGWRQIR